MLSLEEISLAWTFFWAAGCKSDLPPLEWLLPLTELLSFFVDDLNSVTCSTVTAGCSACAITCGGSLGIQITQSFAVDCLLVCYGKRWLEPKLDFEFRAAPMVCCPRQLPLPGFVTWRELTVPVCIEEALFAGTGVDSVLLEDTLSDFLRRLVLR